MGSGNEIVAYSRVRVLMLTKRHVGSENEIGSAAVVIFTHRSGLPTVFLSKILFPMRKNVKISLSQNNENITLMLCLVTC